MAETDVELLRRAWGAFERGDLEAVTQVLDPQVRWHGADDPDDEGGCHNRDEALAFIRQSLADGVTARALEFRDGGGQVVVILQRDDSAACDERPAPHGEVVTVKNGKVVEMVVYPTVDEALQAAGIPA